MTLDEARKEIHDILRVYATDREEQAFEVVMDALRAAEGQVAHLNAKFAASIRQEGFLLAKLDDTHTNRCFNCEQTVTEATTARQAAVVQMREDASWFQRESQRMQEVVDECAATGTDFKYTGLDYDERAARYRRAAEALSPAARTYEDGVRDAAKAIRDRAVQTFGKVSTVAGEYACVAESLLSPAPTVAPVAAPKPGPTTVDVTEVQAQMDRIYGATADRVEARVAQKPPFDAEAALVAMAMASPPGSAIERAVVAALAAGRGGGR